MPPPPRPPLGTPRTHHTTTVVQEQPQRRAEECGAGFVGSGHDEPTTATMVHCNDDSHARHTQGAPSSALSTTPSTGPRPRHRARERTPTAHDDDGSAQRRDDADGRSGMAKGCSGAAADVNDILKEIMDDDVKKS